MRTALGETEVLRSVLRATAGEDSGWRSKVRAHGGPQGNSMVKPSFCIENIW